MMHMNIKQQIDNPRIWQLITSLLTVILTYFGYTQYQPNGATTPQDLDIDVVMPSEHGHKDWSGNINSAISKSIADHVDKHH